MTNYYYFLLFFQILNFMHAQSTYFHQGYDLMNDLDVYMKTVSKQVSEIKYLYPVPKI